MRSLQEIRVSARPAVVQSRQSPCMRKGNLRPIASIHIRVTIVMGYGEPVFVARDGGAAEDDGWVIALRHNRETDLSDLCVFDAAAIDADPVAVVHLPARVPNGFHGNWMPDE